MNDFIGNEIKVGNKVAFMLPYYKYSLLKATVEKITPKGVCITYINRFGRKKKIFRTKKQIMLIK